MIQGSSEWVAARIGCCTASRFGDIKYTKSGDLTQTAETYLLDLISEHLTGKPARTVKTYAMEWGHRWEPVAREAYRAKTGNEVEEVGFQTHGNEPFVGCSPDGIINGGFLDRGSIEIKAPLTPANHMRVIVDGMIPDEHMPQVHGVMWLTAARWCDFISYHDDFPDRWKLLVIRVPRDDDYIEQLRCKVIAFRDEMISRLNKIIERWEA